MGLQMPECFVLISEAGARSKSGSHCIAREVTGLPGEGKARLDKCRLDGLVQKYFVKGLAESTTRTYSCGQRRFLSFCQAAATPASEGVLCRFVASLASEGLKHRSIKTYLAGVRHLHIREGCGDPFVPVLHRLHYVMRGIRDVELTGGGSACPSLLQS